MECICYNSLIGIETMLKKQGEIFWKEQQLLYCTHYYFVWTEEYLHIIIKT